MRKKKNSRHRSTDKIKKNVIAESRVEMLVPGSQKENPVAENLVATKVRKNSSVTTLIIAYRIRKKNVLN